MDPLLLTIVLRAIERILIVAAGAGAIYLGYRLFLSMPERDRSSGKLELPGGVSIYLSRIGPGVFFSLFGATVIALSLQFGVSFSDGVRPADAVAAAGDAAMVPAAAAGRSYSGLVGNPAATTGASETERVNALVTIRNLNRVPPALRGDIAQRQRIDIDRAVHDAKLRVIGSVWDEAAWGPYPRFLAWVDDGEPEPPPAEIRAAADLFRAGSDEAATR